MRYTCVQMRAAVLCVHVAVLVLCVQWDAAVKEFTSGLKCAQGTRREADLLVRRSNALVRWVDRVEVLLSFFWWWWWWC